MKTITYLLFLFFMLFSRIGFAQSSDKNDMIQEENMENLSVYPNPVSHGKLYVVTKNNLTKQVEIYNVLGKKILSETLSGKELNISKIKPGIYIIKITENNISATRKLIVK
ncbi:MULTISPECIES: T9SS type A sorting domain-containing protein [unclassified Bizionia]|uniref:T9SS type A sorting domain-containing protein n=1 Tax=unclassified Bizionia TaxID=2626393 RepID=UPI0020BF153A|nr:T9SS type A sorting domain-containing protein [Bizionia sp. M204]